MSEKCPFCGSVEINPTAFLCGTKVSLDEDDGETVYTIGSYCFQNQLAQTKRELDQSRQREAQAWAVLAAIRDLQSRFKTSTESRTVPGFVAILDSLLAEGPEVLAVVDGYRVDGPHPFNNPWFEDEPDEFQLNVWRDKPALGWSYTSIRVIVLSRDEKEK